MVKKQKTEIVVLLDRSNSMSSIRWSMQKGFDDLIAEQRKVEAPCSVTLAQFDHIYEMVYERRPLDSVPSLNLQPRGWTALNDSLVKLLDATKARFVKTRKEDRPRVFFVVITDGEENRSTEYPGRGNPDVRAKVNYCRDQLGFEFIYLGANQDAKYVGGLLGVADYNTQTYQANAQGVQNVYRSTSNAMTTARTYGSALRLNP